MTSISTRFPKFFPEYHDNLIGKKGLNKPLNLDLGDLSPLAIMDTRPKSLVNISIMLLVSRYGR